MQLRPKLIQLTVLCALFVFACGCQQRYKPSQWKAAKRGVVPPSLESELAANSSNQVSPNNSGSPVRTGRPTGAPGSWSTMPGRGNGTLPIRGWTTLPNRGWSTLPGRNGTTLPAREWSTLPSRGVIDRWSTLPARRGIGEWSSLPSRAPVISPSTLPARGMRGGLELPKPLPGAGLEMPRFTPLRGSTLPTRSRNPLR